MDNGALYGAHGRALIVDLTNGSHDVEPIPEDVFRQFLGGYALAPTSCGNTFRRAPTPWLQMPAFRSSRGC